jgi:hypothetical protein
MENTPSMSRPPFLQNLRENRLRSPLRSAILTDSAPFCYPHQGKDGAAPQVSSGGDDGLFWKPQPPALADPSRRLVNFGSFGIRYGFIRWSRPPWQPDYRIPSRRPFLVGAIYGFWLLRRTPKEECEATITQAPAPVQIRYFQRGFWIAAAITPALSAWLGYELYCVDTGKIPGAMAPQPIPIVYEYLGFWPALFVFPVLGSAACLACLVRVRKLRSHLESADPPEDWAICHCSMTVRDSADQLEGSGNG